jgi:hypothetical protein
MAVKIAKNIVGFSIKKKDAPMAPTQAEPEMMHEELQRPDELKGYTYKIKTPLSDHAMYITINNLVLNIDTEHEQEYPFEIFINSKNMDQFQWILALTRVISAVFRKGGDATFLVEELKQVFDPQGGYFKKGGRFMPSLVAEIGDVLDRHMRRIGLIKDTALSSEHVAMINEKRAQAEGQNQEPDSTEQYPPGAQLCQKCLTTAMVMMDGCMTCLACGDSKCG